MGVIRGSLALPAEAYHADPCETPSLSASIAAILCSSSPKHAWAAHPRLNRAFRREEKTIYDVGTVAHAALLDGEQVFTEVNAPDWRTKAAQLARDEARALGRVPLLVHQAVELRELVQAAREQLEAHEARPALFTDGKPEQTLIWEEPGGVVCRARLDWLRDDHSTVDDLKTTSRSANPEAYSRALFSVGGDVQAAFYLRGLHAITGRDDAEFRWAVIETAPPYALSVVSPGPDVLTIGRKKVDYAIAKWRRCLATGEWPAYPVEVCYADLPPWEETRWLAKEEREHESERRRAA